MKPTDAQAEALADAAQAVTDAKATLKDAQAERERIVREVAATGVSIRAISTPAGLSYQRIGQLLGRADDRLTMDATIEAWCPKCNAAPGEPCDGSQSGGFHIGRHHRRSAIADGEVDDVFEGEPTYVPDVEGS